MLSACQLVLSGQARSVTVQNGAGAANSAVERKLHPTPHSQVLPNTMQQKRCFTIHVDVVGLRPQAREGFMHSEAVPHTSTSPDWSARVVMKGSICRFRVAECLTLDRGPQFKQFGWYGVTSCAWSTPTYHPQSSRMVERVHSQMTEAQ